MQNLFQFPDASSLLPILLGAVFVHACFQLSVSVLTLLSSHSIGRMLPNGRLFNLNVWYISGVIVMITGLQLGMTSLMRLGMAQNPHVTTAVAFGVIPFIALGVVLFYYRRGRGTQLWLPRPATTYITSRAKKTKSSVEAFALGMTTAIAELPFALAPLTIVAYTFQGFVSERWLQLSLGYGFAVTLPLVFVALYISSGHKISSVQRWREEAKNYLRWTSAVALVLLTVYLTVLQLRVLA